MNSQRTRRIAAPTVIALLAILYAIAGCGGEPQATPEPIPRSTASATPASTTSATPSATPAPAVDREITVTVVKKKVTPAPGRVQVAKGSTVRITVTSDVKDSVHVHGYDLTFALSPGTPGSVQFRVDRDGLFEVETHDTKLVLFQLLVR